MELLLIIVLQIGCMNYISLSSPGNNWTDETERRREVSWGGKKKSQDLLAGVGKQAY